MKNIVLKEIIEPKTYPDVSPTFLTDQTMEERKQKLLHVMKSFDYDCLVVYADKEHGSNFEYLTGFIPRFEEGLLIINKKGETHLVLGNENLKMANYSRVPVKLHHSPLFSLPNQPMEGGAPLEDIFMEIGLDKSAKIGIVAWKMFTKNAQAKQLFDIPYFIMEAIKAVVSKEAIVENACDLFIHGSYGVRTRNNANEIAHYEYGANLASTSMLNAMNKVTVGIKESELGACLNSEGQTNNVVTIATAGARFGYANLYPTHKQVQLGENLSLTTSYKGGLSSRSGFVVENESQLPVEQKDYLERIVKPYFNAVVTWLTEEKIGVTGDALYQQIEAIFPKEKYGWHLNPGHLVSDEEWMSSPVYDGSEELIQSGMIFQIDIIPSVSGYNGTSAEECVAIADLELQQEIQAKYPELWERILARRTYLKEKLTIDIHPQILPLSNTVGYLRPYFLAKDKALSVE